MTNLKLTKDKIEALRALSSELADKLEAGESVTIEPPPKVWEPLGGDFYVTTAGRAVEGGAYIPCALHGIERQTREAAERLANDQRIFNRLHAYREEFAPGYVVPEIGACAYTPTCCPDGKYRAFVMESRIAGTIYMPLDVCEDLCDKLNSGEVVL